jgi:hypothetical protein
MKYYGFPHSSWVGVLFLSYRKGSSMNESEAKVEAAIQEKGLNAPRITPDDVDEAIHKQAFYVFPDTTVTVCLLTLDNGFSIVGHSAAASPENFDEELGRGIAARNAREKVWQYLGFRLRERLANLNKSEPVPAGSEYPGNYVEETK